MPHVLKVCSRSEVRKLGSGSSCGCISNIGEVQAALATSRCDAVLYWRYFLSPLPLWSSRTLMTANTNKELFGVVHIMWCMYVRRPDCRNARLLLFRRLFVITSLRCLASGFTIRCVRTSRANQAIVPYTLTRAALTCRKAEAKDRVSYYYKGTARTASGADRDDYRGAGWVVIRLRLPIPSTQILLRAATSSMVTGS
jgi:hypothetical protein